MKWWKGQEELTEDEKHHMKTDGKTVEMVIRNVLCEDAGAYSCTIGDQKTTSEIKVRSRFFYSHTFIALLVRSHYSTWICHFSMAF